MTPVRRPLSLTLRLTLLFGVASAAIFVVFGWLIGNATEAHFEAEDNSELVVIAEAVSNALAEAESSGTIEGLDRRFEDIRVGHHGAALYIAARDCEPIYANSEPELGRVACTQAKNTDTDSTVHWNDSNHSHRALVRRLALSSQTYTVAVSVPIDFHIQFLAAFRQTLWIMIALSISVISALGWIVARRGHAPLRAIINRVRQINADGLADRLAPDALPSDLAGLAESVNDLLFRIDTAFRRLSDFNADVAHELRTPITNLLAQSQVALSRVRSAEEYRDVLYSNVEECERLAGMITDMLFLAMTDHGDRELHFTNVDLLAEVHDLYDYYEVWAEERAVSLQVIGSGTVTGDRQMLRRAISNLLSNAIRHATPGKFVTITIDPPSNGHLRFSIENAGTEIGPDHLPRLFDRFFRIDASRQRNGDGAGLGLAIVKSIVDHHQGAIEVTSSHGLTRFSLSIPV